MLILLALVVIGTTIWIGIDASQREWSDGFSTAAWVVGALLLWILVFPYYLVRRGKAPLKGSPSPAPVASFQQAPPTLSAQGGQAPLVPAPRTTQYAPLTPAQTHSAGGPPPSAGFSPPKCASCSGPIESHLLVFGSNQCQSCSDGGRHVSTVANSSLDAPPPQSSHTARNVILAIAGLIVLSLVGCSVLLGSAMNSATATHTEIVHVGAPPDGCWSGAIGDSTKDGCGPADITISQAGPIAAANAQKQTEGDWQLTLSLEIGGKIVDSSVTTAEYGIAEVSGGDF
jgi:hypothetical protein